MRGRCRMGTSLGVGKVIHAGACALFPPCLCRSVCPFPCRSVCPFRYRENRYPGIRPPPPVDSRLPTPNDAVRTARRRPSSEALLALGQAASDFEGAGAAPQVSAAVHAELEQDERTQGLDQAPPRVPKLVAPSPASALRFELRKLSRGLLSRRSGCCSSSSTR